MGYSDMAKRRRRSTRVLTTPQGSAWSVPLARPIAVTSPPDSLAQHWRYLDALQHEKPAIYRAVLAHTRRLAERHTKSFKRRAQIVKYEQSHKSSS